MLTFAELSEARARVVAAYDPELVRDAGHQMVDLLTDHFHRVQSCGGAVLPWRDPSLNVDEAARLLEQHASTGADRAEVARRFSKLVEVMLQRGHNLHDPRYIGHQVPASVPLAGLFDAVGSATNQPMTIYDMGPWATAAEWAMVDCLGRQIGWEPEQFSGIVTHGGSLANLTALLTARNVAIGSSWELGLHGSDLPPVLVVHSDAHYSVGRAAGVLGLGTAQIVRVGIDSQRRMDPNHLEDTLRRLRKTNQRVVAVVACSCSTPIGAFDPLPEIADVCHRYDVWLHADAAHGGSACISPRYRHLVSGLDRADSVVWDAHKMLFMPALCAFVFFRDKKNRFEAFRQEAPYLFDPAAPGLAEFDGGLRTIECTKRAAAFGLWGVWATYGRQLFTDLINVTFGLGKIFFEKLEAAPDFEVLHEPQCNIVVFRHLPETLSDHTTDRVGEFQLELRRRVIESGEFYIVSTKIDGVGALRATIINPLTTPDHLDQLLDSIRCHGRELLKDK